MPAFKTGGTASRLRQKNSEMAARLKAEGIVRRSCRCPICHGLVALDRLHAHLGKCRPRNPGE